MPNPCPFCGKDRTLVGIKHLCMPPPEPPAATGGRKKTGRPRIEDRDKTLKATQPWKQEGMSRSSWFRRNKRGQ